MRFIIGIIFIEFLIFSDLCLSLNERPVVLLKCLISVSSIHLLSLFFSIQTSDPYVSIDTARLILSIMTKYLKPSKCVPGFPNNSLKSSKNRLASFMHVWAHFLPMKTQAVWEAENIGLPSPLSDLQYFFILIVWVQSLSLKTNARYGGTSDTEALPPYFFISIICTSFEHCISSFRHTPFL